MTGHHDDATAPLDDDQTTAWRALVLFWRLGLPQLDRTFRRHGMTHLEYGLLVVLGEQRDGQLSAGDLAALAGVTSSRLSHRLRAMEERGDVQRLADPHDGRGTVVRITTAGRRRAEAATGEHRADVRTLVFDRLTPEQTQALADAMGAVAGPLSDHPFLRAGTTTADDQLG